MKKYIKFIPIVIGIIVVVLFLNKKETKIETEIEESVLEPVVETMDKKETIQVEIKEEVVNPGVYEIELGSRVVDLITLAGGLTEQAVLANINQAKKLVDEMVIVIYNQNDLVKEVKTEYVYLECECPEVKNDACITDESDDSKQDKISINSASLTELMTLKGIGEKTAEKIIEYRKEKPFEKIEDIQNVSGIGTSLYEKIKDSITI